MKRLSHLPVGQFSIHSPLPVNWLSEYAVINHFHICKRTLDAWHEHEGLPKYQIGRLTLYKESEVNEWIEKHRKIPQPKKKGS